MIKNYNYLGFGLGLRTKHYQYILDNTPNVDWFEIISEDYMIPGGKPWYYLEKIREKYPIVMHGVSLNIGSTDPLDKNYLRELKKLISRINPCWVSDHLCWTGINSLNTHDLLPLPYTEEVIEHVSNRVAEVQDIIGYQLLLENPSSYLSFRSSTLSEWHCLQEICQRADCKLLLDVNNIYVSSFNNNFDPIEYIDNIPGDRVQQIHLAGHTNYGDHIIDTHDDEIIDDVWSLYAYTINKFGQISTMIERDDNIPELPELLKELDNARDICKTIKDNNNVTTTATAIS